MIQNEYSMIITTCADKKAAKTITKVLLEKWLVACVQMLPVESVYVWQGKICDDNETVLFIKSKTILFDKIAAVVKENYWVKKCFSQKPSAMNTEHIKRSLCGISDAEREKHETVHCRQFFRTNEIKACRPA